MGYYSARGEIIELFERILAILLLLQDNYCDACVALAVWGKAVARDTWVLGQEFPYGITHGPGTLAVDDADGGVIGHDGSIQVGVQAVQGFIHREAAQVELVWGWWWGYR